MGGLWRFSSMVPKSLFRGHWGQRNFAVEFWDFDLDFFLSDKTTALYLGNVRQPSVGQTIAEVWIISCYIFKGCLILESFSIWLKSPKIGSKSLPRELSTKRKDDQGSDLALMFGDLSRREKLLELRPPVTVQCTASKLWSFIIELFFLLFRPNFTTFSWKLPSRKTQDN